MFNKQQVYFILTGMNKMIIKMILGKVIRRIWCKNNNSGIESWASSGEILANQQQEAEIGDGTNFVVIFAGPLLEEAEELLRLSVTTTEIADGYEMALSKATKELQTIVIGNVENDDEKIKAVIRTAVQSKQFGQEGHRPHF